MVFIITLFPLVSWNIVQISSFLVACIWRRKWKMKLKEAEGGKTTPIPSIAKYTSQKSTNNLSKGGQCRSVEEKKTSTVEEDHGHGEDNSGGGIQVEIG